MVDDPVAGAGTTIIIDRPDRPVDAFKQINPDILIPAHCSGDRFYDLARDALGDKVVHSAVGTRFVFVS